MNEYISMWKRAFDFSGRSTVREFWMAVLFNIIAAVILGIIVAIISPLIFISWIYSVAAIIPGIALSIRRLRDAGYSPLLLLLALIPFVGGIVLIILCCMPTKQ